MGIIAPNAGVSAAAGGTCDLDKLVADISEQIADYEVKKLAQLKGEIEGFIKKKDALIEDYRKKHPELLRLWGEQNTAIDIVRKTLECRFPDWDETFKSCVCNTLEALETRQVELDARRCCGKGPREKARDKAKKAADAARVLLEGLVGLEKGIGTQIQQDQKWIDDIRKLLSGPDSIQAIHVLWGKLLPAHNQLAPYSLSAELEASLEKAACKPGKVVNDKCEIVDPPASHKRSPPWLIEPEDYDGALQQAWCAYRDAKEKYGKAEGVFAGDPDDIEATAKKIEADRKELDATIRGCLKKATTSKADCGCDGNTDELTDEVKPRQMAGEDGETDNPPEGSDEDTGA